MHASGSSAGDSIIEPTASHLTSRSPGSLCTFKTSFGTAAVADHIPPQEYETWVAGFENYPLDHRYYEIIHESLKAQFAHYYLLRITRNIIADIWIDCGSPGLRGCRACRPPVWI